MGSSYGTIVHIGHIIIWSLLYLLPRSSSMFRKEYFKVTRNAMTKSPEWRSQQIYHNNSEKMSHGIFNETVRWFIWLDTKHDVKIKYFVTYKIRMAPTVRLPNFNIFFFFCCTKRNFCTNLSFCCCFVQNTDGGIGWSKALITNVNTQFHSGFGWFSPVDLIDELKSLTDIYCN